jgi:hypothetical protein
LANFNFADDGTPSHGTIVYDPPVSSSTPAIGGAPNPSAFGFNFSEGGGGIVYDPPVSSSTPAIGSAPNPGAFGFNFSEGGGGIVQTVEHALQEVIKPEVAVIKELLGSAGGAFGSLIDHPAAADGQFGGNTILSQHDFHLS